LTIKLRLCHTRPTLPALVLNIDYAFQGGKQMRGGASEFHL
jgi:hypothetical protein